VTGSFTRSAWLRAAKGTAFYRRLKKSFVYRFIQKRREDKRTSAVFRQGTATLHVGDFTIALPDKHPLIDWQRSQPYRDQHIGISAGLFGRKYPRAALIDIGANVGDSAARMASHCRNDLILIEPSPLYLKYLKKNAALFHNKTMIEEVLIGGESMGHGNLVHTGGSLLRARQAGRAEAVRHKATLGLSRGRVPHQM
jgi:hypothetical protein